jgi:hypothetical protein
MANTFKNATLVAASKDVDNYLYTVPAATTAIAHAVFISNTGDATIQVDLKMIDASAATTSSIVTNAPIMPGGTFVLDKPLNLETLDSVVVQPDTSGSAHVVASILQIT